MIAWVFDVDGVLCDSGNLITDDFKQWFLEWSQDKSIFLVTGSERSATIRQIGQEIVDRALVCYNCLGNSIWVKNQEYKINQFILTNQEINWLNNAVASSPFPVKTGNHINIRPGSINFSVVGKNADPELRKQYNQWDKIYKERETIIKNFLKEFPRFDAYMGGEISIDICRRSANKSQVFNYIMQYKGVESINFFADKTDTLGIDKPFADLIPSVAASKLFKVVGYNQTWEILKTL